MPGATQGTVPVVRSGPASSHQRRRRRSLERQQGHAMTDALRCVALAFVLVVSAGAVSSAEAADITIVPVQQAPTAAKNDGRHDFAFRYQIAYT
jgi:hypothetical protein